MIWIFLGVALLFVGLVWGSADTRSPLYLRMLRRGNGENGKSVCLTFDDGPDANATPRVLDTLRELGVPACFFLVGRHIAGNEFLVRRMIAEGHVVALHGWWHRWYMPFFPKTVLMRSLWQEQQQLRSILGRTPRLFRPPYGVTSPGIGGAVRALDLVPVAWSIRSYDTVGLHRGVVSPSDWIRRRIIRNLHPGAVILLHDRTMCDGNILYDLVGQVRAAGYKFSGIEGMLAITAYGGKEDA